MCNPNENDKELRDDDRITTSSWGKYTIHKIF